MPSPLGAILAAVLTPALLVACAGAEGGSTANEEPKGTAPSVPLDQQPKRVPGTEVRAESSTLETWALLYQPPPWRAGEDVKVVWRTTGSGDFSVVAVGPESQVVAPVSGPTEHTGSNWNRPGDEWGTFFRLDEPGQWVLRVERGQGTASLPISGLSHF